MRILSISSEKDLKQLMRNMKVDDYGIKIMLPKAQSFLLKVNALNNISANILKQEMLSLGGDVAVARGALTGTVKNTDCLIMGNLSQLCRLSHKLYKQPFGLDRLSRDLNLALQNFRKEDLSLVMGKYKFLLGKRTLIMGIVNVTPDSFSSDGLYRQADIVDHAQRLVREGADIIDIGGESTRPGAKPVSLKDELSRVIPVIKILSKQLKVPISVDTYKPEVAKAALDNGASMVNDITALKNNKMAKIIAKSNAAVVVMHMRGNPRSMQTNPHYKSLIDEVADYLANAVNKGIEAGIGRDRIIIDPGIGFGKTLQHNLEILKRLKEFKTLGQPILVGTSRKSFIGKILNNTVQERLFGTLASCIVASENGADIVRVHDVNAIKEALLIRDSLEK